MSAERPTLVDPPIEPMLAACENSKFTLVQVAAMRARRITEYKTSLGSASNVDGKLIPPQVNSNSNKALTMAFEELSEGKLEMHRKTDEEIAREIAEEEERQRLSSETEKVDLARELANFD